MQKLFYTDDHYDIGAFKLKKNIFRIPVPPWFYLFFFTLSWKRSQLYPKRETSAFSMKVKPSPHPAGHLDEDS